MLQEFFMLRKRPIIITPGIWVTIILMHLAMSCEFNSYTQGYFIPAEMKMHSSKN